MILLLIQIAEDLILSHTSYIFDFYYYLSIDEFIFYMFLKEIKIFLMHIRFPLQAYTLLGFLFGLLIGKINFDYIVLLAFLSWFLLCAGITVFNSYYDKDEKPVAGLKKPPKASKSMFYGSLSIQLTGFLISLLINMTFTFFYILTFILTFLYSHKNFRLKSNGFIALFVNFLVGFNTFSATISLNNNLISISNIFGAIGSGLFLVSVYLMMQVHQIIEDKNRKDISVAVKFGRKVTIILSLMFLILAGFSITIAFYFSYLPKWILIMNIIYFTSALVMLLSWMKQRFNNDFNIMTKITNYLSYLGCIILLILYFYFV